MWSVTDHEMLRSKEYFLKLVEEGTIRYIGASHSLHTL